LNTCAYLLLLSILPNSTDLVKFREERVWRKRKFYLYQNEST